MPFREVASVTLDKPQKFREVTNVTLDEQEPFQFGGGGRSTAGATEEFELSPEVLLKDYTRQMGLEGAFDPTLDPVKKAIASAPGSLYTFASNIATVLRHPIETAKSFGSLAQSVVENVNPDSTALFATLGLKSKKQIVKGVAKFYSDRYGSVKKAQEVFETDPVGFAADASLVVGLTAKVAKAFGASKVGAILTEYSQSLEPVRAVQKVAKPITEGVGKLGRGVTGFTTDTSPGTIRKAYLGKPAYRRAISGEALPDEAVEAAKSSMQSIKDHRTQQYLETLDSLAGDTRQFDISSVTAELNKQLTKFKVDLTSENPFRFTKLRNDAGAQGDILKLVETIDDWKNTPTQLTASGLDTLKQSLSGLFHESNLSRAPVTAVRKSVKKILVDNVKGYEKASTNFKKSIKFLNEIEKDFNLGTKNSVKQGLSKLTEAMKSNDDLTFKLLEDMERKSGIDIQSILAGRALRPMTPPNINKKLLGEAFVIQALASYDPTIYAAVVLASPRVVGEFVSLLGSAARTTQQVTAGPTLEALNVLGREQRRQAEEQE
jgi:hypothetical protein